MLGPGAEAARRQSSQVFSAATASLSVGRQGDPSCAPTPKVRALTAKSGEHHGPASEGGVGPGNGFHLSSSMLTEHFSKGRRASSATTCFRPANRFPKPPLPHNSVSAADGSTQLASSFPRPPLPSSPSAAAGGEGRPVCSSALPHPCPSASPGLSEMRGVFLPPSLMLRSWCSS